MKGREEIMNYELRITKGLLVTAAMLIMLAAAAAPARAQVNGDLTVWCNYTYSSTATIDASGNYPACTAAVTKSCVSGFNIYDVTSGTVKLGTISNPSPAAGAVQAMGDLTLTNVKFGTHTIEATAAYFDANGVSGESAFSLPASFQIQPPPAKPPTGFKATFKQQ